MPWIAHMKLPQIDKKYIRIINLFISGMGIIALALITASLTSIKFLPSENIDIKYSPHAGNVGDYKFLSLSSTR